MKKVYVIPAILVSDAVPCDILAASSWTQEGTEKQKLQKAAARFNYLCPHIPADTRCSKYNWFVRASEGIFVPPSDTPERQRISTRSTQACPYKGTCDRLKKYMELTNGKQH